LKKKKETIKLISLLKSLNREYPSSGSDLGEKAPTFQKHKTTQRFQSVWLPLTSPIVDYGESSWALRWPGPFRNASEDRGYLTRLPDTTPVISSTAVTASFVESLALLISQATQW